MAAFRRAYDIIQQTIEMLDNSEITSFEIDGISLRIDYLTRTLVNLDSNCTPTYEIVQLLGETSRHLHEVDSQSTVCAIQYAPKIYSGECGRPTFKIKEEQLSFLIDQGFQVPVIAQLFRVSTRTITLKVDSFLKLHDSLGKKNNSSLKNLLSLFLRHHGRTVILLIRICVLRRRKIPLL